MNKPRKISCWTKSFHFKATLASFAALAFGAHTLHAQTVYFDPSGSSSATQTGNWSTAAVDWNTATDGSGTTETFPSGDAAVFSLTSTLTTTSTVTMGSAITASGITFATGATTILGADAITVGAGGITVASGATASIGNAQASTTVATTVEETWTNNSSTALIIGGGSIGGGTTQGTGLILDGGNIELGDTGQHNGFSGSGSITVDAGTLTIGGQGSALGGRNVYLVSGTIATLASKNPSLINAFLEGNFASSVGGAQQNPIASLTLDGNYILTANASSYTVVNVIQDGSAGSILDVAGAGTVAINGNSTYDGGTTIGTGAALSIGAGSTTGDLTIGGTVTGYTGGTVSNSGTLQVNRSNSYSFNGFITGSGGFSQIGGGTTTLTDASNNYTGVTTTSGGTLSVSTLANGGTASDIGSATNAAANLVIAGGVLQYIGGGASTDHLFQIGLANDVGMTGVIDASGTGPIDFTNTGSVTYGTGGKSAAIVLTGTNTGLNTMGVKIVDDKYTSVSKTGAGTWVLTNANTYSSGTTVAASSTLAGGLLLAGNSSGSATGSGAVAVTGYSGTFTSALGGTGIIAPTGTNTVAMGNYSILEPGTPSTIGTLQIGGASNTAPNILTFTAGTSGTGAPSLLYKLGASQTNDEMAVTGKISFYGGSSASGTGNTINFSNISGGALTLGLYPLITDSTSTPYTGLTLGGSAPDGNTLILGGLLIGSGLSGYTDDLELTAGNSIDLDITAVPEPATWLAGLACGGLLVFELRRRLRLGWLRA